jgi:hypothetical protein
MEAKAVTAKRPQFEGLNLNYSLNVDVPHLGLEGGGNGGLKNSV